MWTVPATMRRMTQYSRWSLAHTGNRALVAVVVGLATSCLIGTVGVHGVADVVVSALVAVAAYALITALHRAR